MATFPNKNTTPAKNLQSIDGKLKSLIRQMIIPARKRYDRTRLTVPLLFVNKDKERISLISIYRQPHIPVRIVPAREYDP